VGTSEGPDTATYHYDLDGLPQSVTYRIDRLGQVTSLVLDRWGDPDGTGTWARHRFGGHITAYRRWGDVLLPASGLIGWDVDTERWPQGAFFDFSVTDARFC
jgi:hypothetical protein